jgi:hypothetical protein
LLRWISDGIVDDTFVCRLVSGLQRPCTVGVSPSELRCSCISMVLAWIGLVTGREEPRIAPFSRWAFGEIVDDIVRRLVSGLQRPCSVGLPPSELRCSCISMVLAWVWLVTGGRRLGVWPLEGYRGVENVVQLVSNACRLG